MFPRAELGPAPLNLINMQSLTATKTCTHPSHTHPGLSCHRAQASPVVGYRILRDVLSEIQLPHVPGLFLLIILCYKVRKIQFFCWIKSPPFLFFLLALLFIAFVDRWCTRLRVCIYMCVCPPAYLPASIGMEGPMSHRAPLGPPSVARFHRRRTSGTRDERYRSGTDATPYRYFIGRIKKINIQMIWNYPHWNFWCLIYNEISWALLINKWTPGRYCKKKKITPCSNRIFLELSKLAFCCILLCFWYTLIQWAI